MFMDLKPKAIVNSYVQIETEIPKRRMQLTKKHLIIKSKDGKNFEACFAEKVEPGDFVKVLSSNGTTLVIAKVNKVSVQRNYGAFAPLTEEGTILVNGILASCYALTENHNTAHLSFWPWRIFNGFIDRFTDNKTQTGQHWYVHMLRTINQLTGLLPEIYTL